MMIDKHIMYVWVATLTSLSLAQWNEIAGITSFTVATLYTIYKWIKKSKQL
jgi:hypothetical protein